MREIVSGSNRTISWHAAILNIFQTTTTTRTGQSKSRNLVFGVLTQNDGRLGFLDDFILGCLKQVRFREFANLEFHNGADCETVVYMEDQNGRGTSSFGSQRPEFRPCWFFVCLLISGCFRSMVNRQPPISFFF